MRYRGTDDVSSIKSLEAQQFGEQAKASDGFSESLVYLMRSVERDTRADLLEVCDMPEPDTVNHQTRGSARR